MRTPWFRWALALQLLVFLAWIGLEERKRIPVATVVLETVPVDPRDLWAGQYMRLAYRISDITKVKGFPADGISGPVSIRVRLEPVTAPGSARVVWRAVECRLDDATSEPPADGVWVTGIWGGRSRLVDYGIGRYYFSESRKEEMNTLRSGRLLVECAVSRSGSLTIRRIME